MCYSCPTSDGVSTDSKIDASDITDMLCHAQYQMWHNRNSQCHVTNLCRYKQYLIELVYTKYKTFNSLFNVVFEDAYKIFLISINQLNNLN